MINRRKILMLSSAMAVLSSARVNACSYAPYSSQDNASENNNINKLFESWFNKDRAVFEKLLASVTGPSAYVKEIEKNYSDSIEQFDKFFQKSGFYRAINFIVNVGGEIMVGCYEIDVSDEADHGACEDTPYFHTFRIETIDNKASKITHISTSRNPYVGKIGVWTNG